jgi:hypothetical protein
MAIVAAGVHLSIKLRAMCELIMFLQWQRIHVCAQANCT